MRKIINKLKEPGNVKHPHKNKYAGMVLRGEVGARQRERAKRAKNFKNIRSEEADNTDSEDYSVTSPKTYTLIKEGSWWRYVAPSGHQQVYSADWSTGFREEEVLTIARQLEQTAPRIEFHGTEEKYQLVNLLNETFYVAILDGKISLPKVKESTPNRRAGRNFDYYGRTSNINDLWTSGRNFA